MTNPDEVSLVEKAKIAFWASLTNANAGMKWLDHDSMEEMIDAAWIGFEEPIRTAATPLVKMREALEERDAKIAKCPIQRAYADHCPRCKATSSETCGIVSLADYTLIETVRAALSSNLEGG